jgi:DNA-binding MarR family transcriptional regulator
MSESDSSSFFTAARQGQTLGPPLIGALLRMPVDSVRRRMLERLHERGFDDLEPAHLVVLQYPGPQGLRPLDLAERVRMSKQAVNHLLGTLERLGYLEREADASDRRSKRIALTARGWSAGLVIREAVAEIEQEWAGQLGEEAFAQLRDRLVELNRIL